MTGRERGRLRYHGHCAFELGLEDGSGKEFIVLLDPWRDPALPRRWIQPLDGCCCQFAQRRRNYLTQPCSTLIGGVAMRMPNGVSGVSKLTVAVRRWFARRFPADALGGPVQVQRLPHLDPTCANCRIDDVRPCACHCAPWLPHALLSCALSPPSVDSPPLSTAAALKKKAPQRRAGALPTHLGRASSETKLTHTIFAHSIGCRASAAVGVLHPPAFRPRCGRCDPRPIHCAARRPAGPAAGRTTASASSLTIHGWRIVCPHSVPTIIL